MNETIQDPTLETASEVKQEAAERTGQSQDTIGSMLFQLRTLRENGVLIDITVGGTTLFSRRASLAELGIPRKSMRGENITAGSRFMGPRKFVNRQASMAERLRSLGKRYGQEVTGFKPYVYIYWKVYDEYKEKWDALIAQFYQMKQEAIDNLALWREEYLDTCREMAAEAWEAMMTNGAAALILHLPHERTKTFEDQEAFTEWIVGRGAAAFPSANRVDHMMHADYQTAVLLSDADITAEKARDAQEHAALGQARADQVEAHARSVEATQDELVAKSEGQLKMDAIHQAELEHAREQLTQIVSPFEEMFANLRSQVYADAQEIAASIRKNGFLNPQVGKRIENLIRLFKMKDATNDHRLTGLLESVQTWAQGTPKQTGKAGKVKAADETSLIQLTQALADVVEATHDSAIATAKRAAAGRDLAVLEL